MSLKIDLPDFDDLYSLSEKIYNAQLAVSTTEQALEDLLARITKRVIEDRSMWIGDKQPSIAYIQSNHHRLGFDEGSQSDLLSLRLLLSQHQATFEKLKRDFTLSVKQIEAWRTFEANKRSSYEQ